MSEYFKKIESSKYLRLQKISKEYDLRLPDKVELFNSNLTDYLSEDRNSVILHLSLATICDENEEYFDSINYLKTILSLSKEFSDLYPRVLSGIGYSYFRVNQFDFAKNYLENSLNQSGMTRPFKAITYSRLGMVCVKLNDLEKASTYCDKATKLIKITDSVKNYRAIHSRRAHIYKLTGQLEESKKIYENLITLYLEKGFHKELIGARNNLSNILKDQNKLVQAEVQLLEAEKLITHDRSKVAVYTNMGELRWLQGDNKAGLQYLKKAKALASPDLHSEYIIYIYEFRAKIYKTLNKPNLFLCHLENTKTAIYHHLHQSSSFDATIQEKLDWVIEEYKALDMGTKANILPEFTGKEPWREMKQRFVYNLIMYHINRFGLSDELYPRMGMTKYNYFILRERLTKKGFEFPNYRQKDPGTGTPLDDEMQIYLKNLSDCRYNSALKIFEKEVFMEVFKSVGYNRKKLAQKLQVSYLMVMKRMTKWVGEEGN